jgi:RNA polymerase sigma-70 factor (ECF subfamily)
MRMERHVRLVAASDGRSVPGGARSAAFEDFFEREALTLFRRMCVVTRNPHEAEEITQDAFMALFERWDRVSGLDDPVGYLYRTAFNRWKKLGRRAAKQVREIVGSAPPDDYGLIDDRAAIDRALAALTPRQRAAIVLTELLGYGSKEAATILGVRDSTVRALASQGRAMLRDLLRSNDE